MMNKVINGDCLEHMKEIDSNSVDLVISDPPYNVNYSYNTYKDNLDWKTYFDWQLDIFKESFRILKDTGSMLWLNYPEAAAMMWVMVQEKTKFIPYEIITWIYNVNTSGKPLRKGTRSWLWFIKDVDKVYIDTEEIKGQYINTSDKRIRKRMEQGLRPVDFDWWYYDIVKNVSAEKVAMDGGSHPCQLPSPMIERLVRMASPVDGLVIDPFGGSGTTAIACIRTERKFIEIDISKQFVEIARQRILEEKKKGRNMKLGDFL